VPDSVLPSWEEIYSSATPAQQQELLALARRQGLIYTHQLPARQIGTAAPPEQRSLVRQLLSGEIAEPEPVSASLIDYYDTALDAVQREAVAKALATPDLFLLRGLPGTGKSRVVAEIVAQAAARGDRVLLVGLSAAAVDRVLELVQSHTDICALRCLGPKEAPPSLPPHSRSLTFTELVPTLNRRSLMAARQGVENRERMWERLHQDESAWGRFEAIVDELDSLHKQIAEHHQRCAGLAAEVEREAAAAEADYAAAEGGTFAAAVQACRDPARAALKVLDADLAELDRSRAERLHEQETLDGRSAALRPLAEARSQGRWWTGLWWRALFRSNLSTEVAALEEEKRRLQAAVEGLDQAVAQLHQKKDQAARTAHAERANRVQAEVAARQALLDQRYTARLGHQKDLERRWDEMVAALDPNGARPSARNRDAIRVARSSWEQQLARAERDREFARKWVACLEAHPPWGAQLPSLANLVAATLPALSTDPHIGATTSAGTVFDLLVLQEANQITEADFLAVARRARRWILVGDPPGASADAAGRRANLSAAVDPGFCQRLWEHLHTDPRSWPYTWAAEGPRLCCRLRPVAPEQRQWIESERVADFPDIELRILTLPQARPVLVELVFPPSMSIAQAKAYVYREVDELAVEAVGHSLHWQEQADRLVLRLTEGASGTTQAIALEAGVRELVECPPSDVNGATNTRRWTTCQLEFDRQAGWNRRRAEDWVQRYLGARDLGRTVHLDVPYRMHPDLAVFLSHLLFAGAYRAANGNGCSARVEFVPVPPLTDKADRNRSPARGAVPGRGAPAVISRKGGAGLELNLADLRHRERLPADLLCGLPDRGFVNHAEAQAVVQMLEALAADAAARGSTPVARPCVAVVALYAAQVELIRRLVRQSPRLASAALPIEIGMPAAFRERDCAVVLVSLTRSHVHRAVSYGEGPQMLALALTRAQTKLVLFGDPGSLARRGQWEGPLDHLDAATAAQERALVTELVNYLQGRGTHPGTFQLREGAGA
jgi:hypothetical protein